MLTIIVPTRDHPEKCRRLWDSLVSTAKHPETVQLVLGYDQEDKGERFHPGWGEEKPRVSIYEQPTTGLARMMRGMVQCFIGEDRSASVLQNSVVILAGDDFVFETTGWDELVTDRVLSEPEPCMFYGSDGIQNEKLATLNIFRADTLLGLDYAFSGMWQSYNDTWLKCIYELWGDKLLRYMPDVKFSHVWHGENPRQTRGWAADRQAIGTPDAWAYAQRQFNYLSTHSTVPRQTNRTRCAGLNVVVQDGEVRTAWEREPWA